MRKKGEKIRVVVYLLFIVAKGDFKLLENVEDKFENAKEICGKNFLKFPLFCPYLVTVGLILYRHSKGKHLKCFTERI